MTHVKGIAVVALVALTLVAYAPEAAAKPKAIGKCPTTITEPGSYALTKSLTAIGDCITVAADFVTIDLDSLVLTGDGTGEGITDGGVGRQVTVIRNGTITNFDIGINLGSSTDSVIEKVRAIGNTNQGMQAVTRSTVTGNTASGNGSTGIDAGPGSTITGNTANGNVAHGINAGNNNTISGNTASGNGTVTDDGTGITAICSVDNVSNIVGNTAQQNDVNGSVADCNLVNNVGF